MELTEQFIRYLMVGALAASIDFLGYNGFLRFVSKRERVRASVFSVTIAMAVSFFLNRNWAFAGINDGGWPVAEFVFVTLFAAYGIQSAVIWTLSRLNLWAEFRSRLGNAFRPRGLDASGDGDLVERNLVKAVAVGVALLWNFSWYRWYVFV